MFVIDYISSLLQGKQELMRLLSTRPIKFHEKNSFLRMRNMIFCSAITPVNMECMMQCMSLSAKTTLMNSEMSNIM